MTREEKGIGGEGKEKMSDRKDKASRKRRSNLRKKRTERMRGEGRAKG